MQAARRPSRCFCKRWSLYRLCIRPVTVGENGLVAFFGMRAYSLHHRNIPPFFIPIPGSHDIFMSHGYTRMKHGCIVAQASILCFFVFLAGIAASASKNAYATVVAQASSLNLCRETADLQTCHQCLRLKHGYTCSISFQLVSFAERHWSANSPPILVAETRMHCSASDQLVSEIRMLLIEKMSLFTSLRLSIGDATTSVISRSPVSCAGSTLRRRNLRIKQNALLIVRSRRGAGRAENGFRWIRLILSKTGFLDGINKIYGIYLLRTVGQEALYPCGEEHPGSGNS